jgi:hypothetical protein
MVQYYWGEGAQQLDVKPTRFKQKGTDSPLDANDVPMTLSKGSEMYKTIDRWERMEVHRW